MTSDNVDLFSTLRRDIVFGRIKPGSHLLEIQLAKRFNVGRYAIRAALEDLRQLGLIQIRPYKGAVVASYSLAEIDHLYEMRDLLQREAIRRLPLPAPLPLIAELKAINAAYAERIEKDDLDEMEAYNHLFHRTFFSLAANPYLAEEIEAYWNRTAAIHSYALGDRGLAKQSCQEHEGIIAALKDDNRELLLTLCIDHMKPALASYKQSCGGWSWEESPAQVR